MISAVLSRTVASAFLAAELRPEAMTLRAAQVLGLRPSTPWLKRLSARVADRFAGRRPRVEEVARLVAGRLRRLSATTWNGLRLANATDWRNEMAPLAAAAAWPVPALTSEQELATWLELTPGELDWFSDLRGWAARAPNERRHYRLRLVRKSSGRYRLIESPKPRLKELQRKILREILERIPAHDAAHAFLRGRSTATFVAAHVGRTVVVRLDLEDFFPTISRARVASRFRAVGYPDPVAARLSGLCAHRCGADALGAFFTPPLAEHERRELRRLERVYDRWRLPQGAPTSPALANLCAWRLDRRLAGMARASGAAYTRYADDLAFSGDAQFARRSRRFSLHVAAIVAEEGFAVNHHKTRIMRRGARQHLAGVVLNDLAQVRREEFDRLKAILTNCARHGPASQNRQGHERFREQLQGRVAYVASWNDRRGAKLRAIFARIEWDR